jgi:hypothetical protein
MITQEMVEEAIKTSHNECSKSAAPTDNPDSLPHGCIHAEAMGAAIKAIAADVSRSALLGMESGDPALSVYVHAVHVGYRLRQIETETTPKERVN